MAFMLAFVLSISSFASTDCGNKAHFGSVTKNELQDLVQKNAVFLVDANSKRSFEKESIPGAIHYGSHENDLASVLPKDKSTLIVTYCFCEKCTAWAKVAQRACELGYSNIKHFPGGISGWMKGSKG
jgi:rhodanese-related sulfurtransferase